VAQLQSGLRSGVQAFVDMLDKVGLHLPLAKPLPQVEIGETQAMGEELTLAPHLLPDDGNWVVGLWSERDQLQTVAQYLQWTTDGENLDIVCLPARIGLELALQLIDEHKVTGLVLNPGDETEVFLTRAEVASIAAGSAIPLVGYVQDIPEQPDEKTLIAELDQPLSPELTTILERWAEQEGVVGFRLQQTFNAERDLEPHLTLRVKVAEGTSDTRALVQPLLRELEGKLPPPGYIDVVFE
jgi:hypothetical protein